jgi:translation initiation factor IF-1
MGSNPVGRTIFGHMRQLQAWPVPGDCFIVEMRMEQAWAELAWRRPICGNAI